MIEEYEFGRIVVNKREYTSDVIIHKDGVEEGWWRKEGHSVCLEDIKRILDLKPEVVIFGTGAYGRMRVKDEVKRYLKEKGIDFFELRTDEAVRLFKSLIDQKKRVVLAAHLTC